MSVEKTFYLGYSNSADFREIQNLSDQGLKTPEEAERFEHLVKKLNPEEVIHILTHSKNIKTIEIILQIRSVLGDSYCMSLPMAYSENHEQLEISEYLRKNFSEQIKFLQSGIGSESYSCFEETVKNTVKFINDNHDMIINVLHSSYWHDHGFKYPLKKIQIYMALINTDGEGDIILYTPLNDTYNEEREMFRLSGLSHKVKPNCEIKYQNLMGYQIARFRGKWKFKLTYISKKTLKEIKCQKCDNVINPVLYFPPNKKVSKSHSWTEPECYKCLKARGAQINEDDYYDDWNPLTYEKWPILGGCTTYVGYGMETYQKMKDLSDDESLHIKDIQFVLPVEYNDIEQLCQCTNPTENPSDEEKISDS